MERCGFEPVEDGITERVEDGQDDAHNGGGGDEYASDDGAKPLGDGEAVVRCQVVLKLSCGRTVGNRRVSHRRVSSSVSQHTYDGGYVRHGDTRPAPFLVPVSTLLWRAVGT